MKFKFEDVDILALMWNFYILGRIEEVLRSSDEFGFSNDPDPMEDSESQMSLIKEWYQKLVMHPKRKDGTIDYPEKIWNLEKAVQGKKATKGG